MKMFDEANYGGKEECFNLNKIDKEEKDNIQIRLKHFMDTVNV